MNGSAQVIHGFSHGLTFKLGILLVGDLDLLCRVSCHVLETLSSVGGCVIGVSTVKDTAINHPVVEGIPALVGVIVLSVLSIDRSVAWGSV